MKRIFFTLSFLAFAFHFIAKAQGNYTPTKENLQSRQEFSDMKFGIFLHWGIYSMFGQGEWYLQNANIDHKEYAKAARGFYPSYFDAKEWVDAIKASGAKYITITSRHHDGFSMWHTKQSNYNIVDATPYGKDVLKALSAECQKQDIRLHLYYSHLDWTREDYPLGRTGRGTHRDNSHPDYQHYLEFMNAQLTELLTDYGPIGAIWFDGYWDHDEDNTPFDWHLDEQYTLIHSLQPSCLVANNHHVAVHPGEDIQIFERDIPGQNTAGLSGQSISKLPLETCQTMNGMWGYKIVDQNYKSAEELIRLLVGTAGKGANLLLNVGPQPSGELPATAISRLHEMGEWLSRFGESIYGTTAGDIQDVAWGTSTRKGNTLYLHVTDPSTTTITLPSSIKFKSATCLNTSSKIKTRKTPQGICISIPHIEKCADVIISVK